MAEVRMTDRAAEALRLLVEREGGVRSLRLFVDHRCYCGGAKYGMALDRPLAGDVEIELGGLRVSLASDVETATGSADVDYVESLFERAFTIANSEHVCGGMGHHPDGHG